jgi:hypothetical protein
MLPFRAMATFTTWAAAYQSMLDDLASGNTRIGMITIGDWSMQYRSHKDFLYLLEYVERRAKTESGEFKPRVYAKQGGRASAI